MLIACLKGFTPTKIKTTQPIRIQCEASEYRFRTSFEPTESTCSTNAYNFSYLNDINMKFPRLFVNIMVSYLITIFKLLSTLAPCSDIDLKIFDSCRTPSKCYAIEISRS